MCTLQIFMQCYYDKFFEVALDESVRAEIFVEEMVGHVLLDLFGAGEVDDVTIQFSSSPSISTHHYAIAIHAQCDCTGYVSSPRSPEHIKRAIEQGLSSIFKELFVTVKFDNILLCPSQRMCERDTRHYCMA